ncbi:MAG: hypothetical protein ACAH83_09350 [Alphaproteobacteria bacterium]
MQRILVSVWVVFVVAIVMSIVAQAQESHPIYDNSPVPGEGSHPIYDNAGPIYDNTRPPPASNATGIGRSINSLQAVQSDLNQSPPDIAGRREKALAHVNAALEELRNIQKAGQ